MTPQEFAKVKEIFANAIRQPEPSREAFVRQASDQDDTIVEEVLSLLSHHTDDTILQTAQQQPEADHQEPEFVGAQPSPLELDPNLVMKDVWEENRQILRRRLLVITVVMGILVACSLVRLFTYSYLGWGYGGRILVLLGIIGCGVALYRNHEMSIKGLRAIEFLVLLLIGMLVAVIEVRLLLALAAEPDVPTLISVHNWGYFVWSIIITVYGVFMPNSWQRAAAITLPLALMPHLITGFAAWLDPQVTVLLQQDDYGIPIPAPLLSACIAIYAAHLIHGARLSAFHARRLAQYRLIRLIGQGSMGQVYEAEHLMMKRSCAIKIIQPERMSDSDSFQRFEREVRATAHLTHPHTIEIFDYGQTRDGVFFYAMELLPGLNLGDLVLASGPLSPARAVHFLVQACGALQEAHRAGLIHRDIKPANIFASQRGGIHDYTKLLDFGLVQANNLDVRRAESNRNLIAGTPDYMSPEQITAPRDLDARSDIYSLGAVAYFLLTGRPPFVADTPLEVLLAHLNDQITPLATINAAIPADLESIILRCLAKDVEQRVPSAQCLINELKDCESIDPWTQEDAKRWWQEVEISHTRFV